MFVYLSTEGRYWLRGLMASVGLALCLGLAMPTTSALARASDTGGETTTKRGVVSMTPEAPRGQDLLGGDGLSQSTFKPWISKSIPWDGNWGAFNDSISERLGGTCALDEKDQKYWAQFLSYRQKKYNELRQKYSGDNLTKKWQQDMNEALKMKDSPSSAIGRVMLGGADSKLVQGLNGFDELQGRVASSPQLASCNRAGAYPEGWLKGYFPNPLNIFKTPARFITQLTLFLPALTGNELYKLLSPYSFGMALTTPHSERGDLLFNSFSILASSGAVSQTTATQLEEKPSGEKPKSSDNLGDLAVQKNCGPSSSPAADGDKGRDYSNFADAQLGFSCPNLNQEGQEQSVWIELANSLRSALSAVYGIIVIGVALLYLVRRNSQSQYHIKVILPRLFLAVILTMAAPYVIGMLITFSNWTVQSIFSSMPGSIPQHLGTALAGIASAGDGMDISGSSFFALPLGLVAPVVLLAIFDIVMIYLLFLALAKQLVLIFLIILTPVACLAFVFRDHGKNLFALWAKGLIAVVAIPVVLAAILAGGLLVSNAFWDPQGSIVASQGLGGNDLNLVDRSALYIAAIVLAATMIMMVKSVGQFRAWVTGNKVGLVGRSIGTGVKVGAMGTGAAVGLATGTPIGIAAGAAIGGMGSKVGGRIRSGGEGRSGFLPESSSTFGAATAAPSGNLIEGMASSLTSHGRTAASGFKDMRMREFQADEVNENMLNNYEKTFDDLENELPEDVQGQFANYMKEWAKDPKRNTAGIEMDGEGKPIFGQFASDPGSLFNKGDQKSGKKRWAAYQAEHQAFVDQYHQGEEMAKGLPTREQAAEPAAPAAPAAQQTVRPTAPAPPRPSSPGVTYTDSGLSVVPAGHAASAISDAKNIHATPPPAASSVAGSEAMDQATAAAAAGGAGGLPSAVSAVAASTASSQNAQSVHDQAVNN